MIGGTAYGCLRWYVVPDIWPLINLLNVPQVDARISIFRGEVRSVASVVSDRLLRAPRDEGFPVQSLVRLFLCKQAGWLGQATNDLISNSSGGVGLTFSGCRS